MLEQMLTPNVENPLYFPLYVGTLSGHNCEWELIHCAQSPHDRHIGLTPTLCPNLMLTTWSPIAVTLPINSWPAIKG